MKPTTEQLLQTALLLPEVERLELVDALLASRDELSELPFDPATLNEIDQRSAEIEAGAVELTPWTIVRKRVRQRLEGRSGERGWRDENRA